jgi:flagellar biosynthesis/type III secretory pathway chaperone
MTRDLLNDLIIRETEALMLLLKALEEQHSLLIKNDIYGLEAVVDKIQSYNKSVAEIEIERRQLTKGGSMQVLVDGYKDEGIDRNYRNIKMLVNELKIQKDTNEMLVRQGLGFSARMLSILSPDRNSKTYNAYGKIGK